MHDIGKKIRLITWLGLFVNLLLAGLKFFAGITGQSHAVIADAIHSLTDLVTDVAVLVGSSYWNTPPDAKHPYGHHRIETLVTIFIGIVLFITAFSIANNAIKMLISGHPPPVGGTMPLMVTLIAILLKEVLYHLTKKSADKLKSSALLANAKHHRSDVFSSLPVLIALIITAFFPNLTSIDKIGAIIVALFIAKASWDICLPAISELVDIGAPPAIKARIRSLVLSVSDVKSTHAIRTRKCGAYYHVDLHIQVDPLLTINEGHIIAGQVKSILTNDYCGIIDVIVHIEPYHK